MACASAIALCIEGTVSGAQARRGEEMKLLLELEAGSSSYGLEVWLQKGQTAVGELPIFTCWDLGCFDLGTF